jgi:hypothetical protein
MWKVEVDCPVCRSGNRFGPEQAGAELACEDCGFVLAGAEWQKALDSGRCVICGGEYFYAAPTLRLPPHGKSPVCYVCEAKYKGVSVGSPGQKFNPEAEAAARRSGAADGLRRRVELYHQGAD